jgi:glycosyltransferase involved in cell wall biosynthesis
MKKRKFLFLFIFIMIILILTKILIFKNILEEEEVEEIIINKKRKVQSKRNIIEQNPLISIILPTYNSMDYLNEAVQSVLQQSYKNFELIIINDCSTDKTKEYLQTLKDKRIKIIHNEVNKKLPSSLNIGFNISKGSYLTWISSDNRCTLNFLSELLKNSFSCQECDFIYSDFYIMNEKSEVIRNYKAGAAVTDGVFFYI